VSVRCGDIECKQCARYINQKCCDAALTSCVPLGARLPVELLVTVSTLADGLVSSITTYFTGSACKCTIHNVQQCQSKSVNHVRYEQAVHVKLSCDSAQLLVQRSLSLAIATVLMCIHRTHVHSVMTHLQLIASVVNSESCFCYSVEIEQTKVNTPLYHKMFHSIQTQIGTQDVHE
jgi:hypothetical protein